MVPPPPVVLAARQGFQAPGSGDFVWPAIWHLQVFGIDISINRVVLSIFLVTGLVIALFLLAFRRPKLVPRGLQNIVELSVDFVKNQVILPIIGPAGLRFLPYLSTLFFFILFSNWLEVIPFFNFPATSRMGIPLFLALLSWLLFVSVGIKTQGLGHYFRNTLFPPGVPWLVYFLVSPIEVVSTFVVRPATLSIRLLANMIAGHLVLTVFFLGTAYLLEGGGIMILFGAAAGVMSVVLVGFEMFVGALQAYIFCVLTAVYLAGSLEPAH